MPPPTDHNTAVPQLGFLTWATHDDARGLAETSGALAQIEAILRKAYAECPPQDRLKGSRVIERGLRATGWSSCRVWAPPGLAKSPNDRYDGWKVFEDGDGQRFGDRLNPCGNVLLRWL